MSVPPVPLGGPVCPTEGMRAAAGENFMYILYHNEVFTWTGDHGVAELEYDADCEGALRQMHFGGGQSSLADMERTITDPKRSAGGNIGRGPIGQGYTVWCTQPEFDYYVAEFERAGWRGGLNYYRNFDRNWRLLQKHGVASNKIDVPVHFIACLLDGVIGASQKVAAAAEAGCKARCTDFRGALFIEDTGHWCQQEADAAVNESLIAFCRSIDAPKLCACRCVTFHSRVVQVVSFVPQQVSPDIYLAC